jgi:DNA-directed RNA polymerase specialized sigma24 family protein
MTEDEYALWLAKAQHYCRCRGDAQDLLQECLLIATRQQRLDLTLETNRKWFAGALKRQAAMIGRTQARRRRREREAVPNAGETPQPHPDDIALLLDKLPRSARTVVVLLLHGMKAEEIIHALKITPAAFRQRLTTIRESLRALSSDFQSAAVALAYYRKPDGSGLELGLIRQALLKLVRYDADLGTHDPDGHLIGIKITNSCSQNAASRQLKSKQKEETGDA